MMSKKHNRVGSVFSVKRKTQNARRRTHNAKGVSLIIVIFAMMLLATLGWSFAVLQSADFEASLRQIDSERALYLAESGTQWALRELTNEFNCDLVGVGTVHNLAYGQYEVNCSCSDPPECSELVLVSTGYLSQESDYRTMRRVEVKISQGIFTQVLAGADLFDWHLTGGYPVDVDGNLQSMSFEGDDPDSWVYPDEDSTPDDLDIPGDGTRTVGPTALPDIDMEYFKDYAENTKGKVFSADTEFDDKDKLNNKGVYYVEGKATINVSNGNITFNHTSLIAEGDIEIIGTNPLSMKTYVDVSAHETFPNLATKNGDIISQDTPNGATSSQKRDARKFDGLIFTQYGNVDFNYINGIAIMGVNVKLRGSIELVYTPKYIESTGFIRGTTEVTNWQEK